MEAAEARVDLPEAVLPELVLEGLAEPLRRADLADPLWRQALAVLVAAEVPAVVVPAGREASAAAARTRSSIPPMARFPTRRKLARNPTT